jgi:hypothetical protein
MYDELLFSIDGQKAQPIDRLTMTALRLEEGTHLQEWLLARPEIIGTGVPGGG